MKTTVKQTLKLATGICVAIGAVTFGAVAASSTAVKVVAESLKAGANAMKQTMAELQAEAKAAAAAEESTPASPASNTMDATPAEVEETSEPSGN